MRRAYGVTIREGVVDIALIAILRAAMITPAGHFDHGAARTAFETVLTRERYEALTSFLAASQIVWRYFLKHRVFAAVESGVHAGHDISGQMAAIFSDIRGTFPAILQLEEAIRWFIWRSLGWGVGDRSW